MKGTVTDRKIQFDSFAGGPSIIRQNSAVWLGYPDVLVLPNRRALITTWVGRCLLIDLETGEVEAQPLVGAKYVGSTLQRLSVAGDKHSICAVATRSTWAGVWRLGDSVARRIPTEVSAANAVALSADGAFLAIGTGMYALGSHQPKCAVEIWALEGRPELVVSTRLPDAAVDRLLWNHSAGCILAWSGARTQDRSHFWMFDENSLRILESAPFEDGGILEGGVDAVGRIVTVGRSLAECLEVTDSRNRGHRWELDGSAIAASLSDPGDEVLLSTGQLLELRTGEHRWVEALPGCVGLGALPGGGFVGISKSGVIRIWE